MVLGLVGLSSKSFGSIRFVQICANGFETLTCTSNVIEHVSPGTLALARSNTPPPARPLSPAALPHAPAAGRAGPTLERLGDPRNSRIPTSRIRVLVFIGQHDYISVDIFRNAPAFGQAWSHETLKVGLFVHAASCISHGFLSME